MFFWAHTHEHVEVSPRLLAEAVTLLSWRRRCCRGPRLVLTLNDVSPDGNLAAIWL